jgi:hypothetical protein
MLSGHERGHPLWRSTAARLAFAIIPCCTTVGVVTLLVPWPMRVAIGLVFAISIISPATGLVAVAMAAPFGELSAVLLGLPVFRASEAVVLAFLAGWLLRGAPDRPGPRLPTVLAWLLSALVVSSVAAASGRGWPTRCPPR